MRTAVEATDVHVVAVAHVDDGCLRGRTLAQPVRLLSALRRAGGRVGAGADEWLGAHRADAFPGLAQPIAAAAVVEADGARLAAEVVDAAVLQVVEPHLGVDRPPARLARFGAVPTVVLGSARFTQREQRQRSFT